jgi:hypothetical protein
MPVGAYWRRVVAVRGNGRPMDAASSAGYCPFITDTYAGSEIRWLWSACVATTAASVLAAGPRPPGQIGCALQSDASCLFNPRVEVSSRSGAGCLRLTVGSPKTVGARLSAVLSVRLTQNSTLPKPPVGHLGGRRLRGICTWSGVADGHGQPFPSPSGAISVVSETLLNIVRRPFTSANYGFATETDEVRRHGGSSSSRALVRGLW